MGAIKEYYVKLARVVRVPIAFKHFCDDNYSLKKISIKDKSELTPEEEKINFKFLIFHNEKKVASFTADGEYDCYDESFSTIFKKITDDLNYAAYKAAKAQDDIAKKLIEEMDSEFDID